MRLRARSSAGPLAKTRLGTVLTSCLAMVVQLGQVGNAGKPDDYLRYSVVAILLLIMMPVITFVRHRVSWWELLLLPALVVVGGSGLIDPLASITLALSVMLSQALYGSTRMWVARSLLGMVSVPLAVVVSPMSGDRPMPWNSVSVLGLLPQILLVSVLMRGIYTALLRQEHTSRREAVLLSLGRGLLGVTDARRVLERGHQAAAELARLCPGSAAILVERTPGGTRIVDLVGLPPELRGRPVPESALADGTGLPIDAGFTGWRSESSDHGLHLLVGGTQRLRHEVYDAYFAAFHQVVLAEAGCRSHAELDHRANHDQLTQLPNRGKFFRRLAAAVNACAPGTVALLTIDLDDFKQVNDTYGHAAGDGVLVEAAARIRAAGGPASMAARFGGDEFALLLTGLDAGDDVARIAQEVAESLCARLSDPVHLAEATVTVGATIGVAVTRPGRTADYLMRGADLAMYSAKALGKNRVQVFDQDQHGAHAKRTRQLIET